MSLEYDTESAIISILKQEVALSAFQIVHRDRDGTAANTEDDRISVNCGPREVGLPGYSLGLVAFWRIPVEIELHYVTEDVAAYNAVIAAIESALRTTCNGQIPDASAATWVASFGGLMKAKLEQTSDGTQTTDSNTRLRAKNFSMLVEA